MEPNLVILTGAGISAESGIATFRASDGLWEEHRVEDVASPEGFRRDPQLVFRFYNARRRTLLAPAIQPNRAHVALAELEQQWRGQFTLVTQNIDDLHERAGSQRVLHMHGELLKARCDACGALYDERSDFDIESVCRRCGQRGGLRPHVVWFGEMPLYMDEIERALSACDIFVAIGTSGNVYPAAGFVQMATAAGARTVEINLEKTVGTALFASGYYGVASEQVDRWVDQLTVS